MSNLIPIKETIKFQIVERTYEKTKTVGKHYKMDLLNKRIKTILITGDYIKETLSINEKTYKVIHNSEFTYKKGRGKNIEAASFIGLMNHIKCSMDKNDIFHNTTATFLKKCEN